MYASGIMPLDMGVFIHLVQLLFSNGICGIYKSRTRCLWDETKISQWFGHVTFYLVILALGHHIAFSLVESPHQRSLWNIAVSPFGIGISLYSAVKLWYRKNFVILHDFRWPVTTKLFNGHANLNCGVKHIQLYPINHMVPSFMSAFNPFNFCIQ